MKHKPASVSKRTLHRNPTPEEFGLDSGREELGVDPGLDGFGSDPGREGAIPEQMVPLKSEYEKLLREIHELRDEIVRLTALRDDLVYRVCPSLRAIYEEEIGSIEREILAAQIYLREKQRIVELLNAQMNRREKVSFEKAEEQAGKEKQDYEEDLKRRARAADEFKERWHSGTKWSSRKYEGYGESEGFGESGNSGESEGFRKSENSGESKGFRESENSGESGNPGDGAGEGPSRNAGRGTQDTDGRESGKKGSDPGAKEEEQKLSFLQRIKQLYRKIVKRLHPDVRQEQSDHEKDLFRRAQDAYEKGDLDLLEQIWDELEGMGDAEKSFEDTPDDIARMRTILTKLKVLLSSLRMEIASIRAEFPYTMKDILENKDLLAARKEELKKLLQSVREANSALDETIRKLRSEMHI